MPMDEPVPMRRAAVGCLLIALGGVAVALIVRPAIFSLAPPRDDTAVIVATSSEIVDGPVQRDVLLTRSYGWPGERDAGDGRTQLSVIVAPAPFATVSAVAAASPVTPGCAVAIGQGLLSDCDGNAWTFDGAPLETGQQPLARFPVEVEGGSVTVDFTRTIDD
jgi:hypothetical protein